MAFAPDHSVVWLAFELAEPNPSGDDSQMRWEILLNKYFRNALNQTENVLHICELFGLLLSGNNEPCQVLEHNLCICEHSVVVVAVYILCMAVLSTMLSVRIYPKQAFNALSKCQFIQFFGAVALCVQRKNTLHAIVCIHTCMRALSYSMAQTTKRFLWWPCMLCWEKHM